MRILALDTSTPWETIAIVEEKDIRAEYLAKVDTTHSTRLVMAVMHMLQESGLSPGDVEAFAAGCGPGSFTGLRIGLASILGMAKALKKPAIGIPTLDSMARAVLSPGIPVCPLIDARRGEVFTAVYRPDEGGTPVRQTPYMVLSPERLPEVLGCEQALFMGDALLCHKEGIQRAFGQKALFAPLETWHPRASVIGRMAIEVLDSGQTDTFARLVPIYVRLSDAEIHRRPHSSSA